MPELPEVEVTRQRIEPFLVGRTISRIETTPDSYFFLTKPARLKAALAGRSIKALRRLGKYLLAELDDGRSLLLHLGMTGQLFTSGSASVRLLSAKKKQALLPSGMRAFEPDQHTHLRVHFSDAGPMLLFRDVRKFGKIALLRAGGTDPRLAKLGVDALVASGAELFEATRARKIPIKSLLLDQSVIAGIGNIYADEALFLAKVRPTRAAKRVTLTEAEAIVKAAKRVLLRSIKAGGSSISDYVQPNGEDGAYQRQHWVYARNGEACRVCGSEIQRSVLGQRSTHFCPQCQR